MRKRLSKAILFRNNGGSFMHYLRKKILKSTPRQLLNGTPDKYWNHSARRINLIMRGKDFDYLEIGVAYGTTFQAINARIKVGVDPNPLFDLNRLPVNVSHYSENSDIFFQRNVSQMKFDFIFLDGLHESKQLRRDFLNSLKLLRNRGWILVDDVIPTDSISAIPSISESYSKRGVLASEGFPWHGDCFRILPWIYQLDFLDSYLIIYPDNPQLLIQVNDTHACEKYLKEAESHLENNDHLGYEEVFSSESLKRMPLYIEEVLIREISLKQV